MAAVARILGLMLAALAGAASAQPPTPPRIGGAAPGPCVTVEIAGDRAGHLECASERLQQAARTAQAQARTRIGVPDATSPDVATGVASQTATRQRMGSAFGVSVQPQRPNRPPPLPRPGGRR